MILQAFAVFDVKADAFKAPFYMPARGLALRAFEDAVNNKETEISRHPEDFKLVLVGEFDDLSGVCRPVEHVSLGFASDFVRESA